VIALLQNEQPGRIHGKGERGLQAEMNVVNACWHRDSHFALLHDSTNILRIDDGTVCNRLHRTDVKQGHDGCPEADYGLFEVKANRRAKPSPEQKQRHQAALAAINEGADIKTKAGFRRQFQWQDGYDSHQDQLSQVLDRAMSDGHGAAQLEEGWVISAVRFVSTDAAASGKPIEDIVDPWQEMQDQLVAKAGFADRPQLKVHSGDAAGRLLKCLPYALFPMSERAQHVAPALGLLLSEEWDHPLVGGQPQSAPFCCKLACPARLAGCGKANQHEHPGDAALTRLQGLLHARTVVSLARLLPVLVLQPAEDIGRTPSAAGVKGLGQ